MAPSWCRRRCGKLVLALCMLVILGFARAQDDAGAGAESQQDAQAEPQAQVQAEVQGELQAEVQGEVQGEVQAEVQADVQAEVPAEVQADTASVRDMQPDSGAGAGHAEGVVESAESLHGPEGREIDLDSVDLSSLSSSELSVLEERLAREVAESDLALEALRRDTESLRVEQEQIDRDAEALVQAREEEAQKKVMRDNELDAAKKEVLSKQASIARMSVRVTDLKKQIDVLEVKLTDLVREKEETERRYSDPSLVDVLDSRSETWGSVSRNVYNKTLHEIMPAFSEMSHVAGTYRMKMSRTSRALELFASGLVYTFMVCAFYSLYVVYKKLRGKLSVGRILFLGDAFYACFWLLILVCYMFLLNDPLRVVQYRSPRMFFVFQLVSITSYVGYTLLRVLVLASTLSLSALGEVMGVIVIGQHYYVRVWQPAILDENFTGTFFFYCCYACVFIAFAFKRASEFVPMKQLQGSRLSLQAYLSILYARLTKNQIPSGDVGDADQIPVHASNGES